MRRALTAILAAALPMAAGAGTACPGLAIEVEAPEPLAQRICQVASDALPRFSACGLELGAPVTFSISQDLGPGCAGYFHCGTREIELLHPEVIASTEIEDSLFKPLDPYLFFDSIVVHELVHAAQDGAPCPFETCQASSEFLAYALQLDWLGPEARAAMGVTLPETPITMEEINIFVALFAPHIFASKSWAFLQQQPDSCAFTGQVARGEVIFDYPDG